MWDSFDLYLFSLLKKLPIFNMNMFGIPVGQYVGIILIMIIIGEVLAIKLKKVSK